MSDPVQALDLREIGIFSSITAIKRPHLRTFTSIESSDATMSDEQRTEYQLSNIDDGFLKLLSTEGVEKNDLRLPEGDLGTKIQAAFDEDIELVITVISAVGEERVEGYRVAASP